MADDVKKDGKIPTPPYLPFKTFKRLIGAFKGTVVPQRIDQSVLGKFSGSDIAALLPALKFFNLIDDNQMVQPLFCDLVESYETSAWKDKFKNLVESTYARIINRLNLSSATRQQLDEKFEAVAARGGVSKKCARFYITAATESGIDLSKHIKERQKTRGGIRYVRIPKNIEKPKEEKGSGEERQDERIIIDPQSLGYREFPIPIKGKQPVKIWIPEDITQEEWNSVKRMMELTTELMQAYFGFISERNEK